MNKINYVAIPAILFAAASWAEPQQTLKTQAQQLIKAYGKQLKSELQQSLKNDGPTAAIGNCQLKVQQLRNADDEWQIGRTSLKVRNPLNMPTAWETTVLAQFEKRKQQGVAIADLQHEHIIEKDGQRYYRYMQAIPTGELCLKCHGDNIAKPVAEKLAAHYPADQAKGFKTGDIRGAFSASKKLD